MLTRSPAQHCKEATLCCDAELANISKTLINAIFIVPLPTIQTHTAVISQVGGFIGCPVRERRSRPICPHKCIVSILVTQTNPILLRTYIENITWKLLNNGIVDTEKIKTNLRLSIWRFLTLNHSLITDFALGWRHNEHDCVWNHQPHDCLLNRLLDADKKTIKAPRHCPWCGEFTDGLWIPHTNGQKRGKWIHRLDNFNFPSTAAKPSFAPFARNPFNSRLPKHHASIDTRGNNGSLWRHNS